MKRVLTAVVLIPLVLVAVFRAPDWLFQVLTGVVAVLSAHEYLALVERHGITPFRKTTLVLIVGSFLPLAPFTGLQVGHLPAEPFIWAMLLLWSPFLLLVLGLGRKDLKSAMPGAAASLLGLPYIALPLIMISTLRALKDGGLWMLYLFLVVWSGDILAYYVGSALGKHKLAPQISPGKTWEGTIASAIAGTVIGTLALTNMGLVADWLLRIGLVRSDSVFGAVSTPASIQLGPAILLSLTVNLAAQVGDLVESMLKRGAGVKDSGALLPGHGGVLDRIDALLFAAPVVWYYAIFHWIFPLQR